MKACCTIVALVLFVPILRADEPAAVEFFESRVRPVLVEHCHKCHAAKAKGGLSLDNRDAMLKGGDSGPAIVVGKPEASRLIEAINYGNVDLQMPPSGKLPAAAIADLSTWVKNGAVWPTSADGAATAAKTFDLAARKASHWCWQPLRVVSPPTADVIDPVDRFIVAKLDAAKIKPSPPADPRVLLRRLHFAITGLPPTVDEIGSFAGSANRQVELERRVDQLLARPAFGERWGRHWLDVVRYAETRGHEFDYPAPNAWQYRDYVIRALNADLPFDRFVHEQIAGDLMPARRHPTEHFNEAIIGTGFWHLGEALHSPVDLKADEADRFDNMIDVFGKAFLGLTVACARCHDHKFDAISAKDYHAIYAVLASSGYRNARLDTEDEHRRVAARLATERAKHDLELRRAIAKVLPADEINVKVAAPGGSLVIDFAKLAAADWRPDGVAFGTGPVKPGALRLSLDPARPLLGVETEAAIAADPAWIDLTEAPGTIRESGDLGPLNRAGRTWRSPAFTLDGRKLLYRVRGKGHVYAAVQSYRVLEGPLHKAIVQKLEGKPEYRWIVHDLSKYAGHRTHLEFTALSPDFAVSQVRWGDAPPADLEFTARPAIERWAAGAAISSSDARIVDAAFRATPDVAELATAVLAEQRRILAGVSRSSRLVMAMSDGSAVDGQVFIRGNPRSLGDTTSRRLLEAFGTPALAGPGSGRLELAEQLTRQPQVARVIVNRVWHHLFGRGLVASVDNFGVLGELPTHPELLDYLADRFVREGWSLKRLIKELVLTQTYQQASTHRSEPADPQNKLLHRMNVHRLEGEAIRDTMLALSGRLDTTMFGPPVPVHLSEFMDGRGKPGKSGPADGAGRRSIYLEVRRNFPPPFLAAFDAPTPFTSIGRRTVSNVPAQALILLNDPFVREQAERFTKGRDTSRMIAESYGRSARTDELRAVDGLSPADAAHALWNAKEFIYID